MAAFPSGDEDLFGEIAEELAACLTYLRQNQAEADSFALRAREYVLREYSWEAFLNRLAGIMDVLDESKAGRLRTG